MTLDARPSDPHAEAFGAMALATYAKEPRGAELLRVQHRHILDVLENMLAMAEEAIGDPRRRALDLKNSLGLLTNLLHTHAMLESGLVLKNLAAEPRLRILAEQQERELASLVMGFDGMAKDWPAASTICRNSAGFLRAIEAQLSTWRERFEREELETLAAFEQLLTRSRSA